MSGKNSKNKRLETQEKDKPDIDIILQVKNERIGRK